MTTKTARPPTQQLQKTQKKTKKAQHAQLAQKKKKKTTPTPAPKTRRPGRPTADIAVPPEREIFARGLEAFAEAGFDGVSVRDLARRLGVSHNFINDRYGTKEGFWRAVVDDSLTSMGDGIERALRQPGASDLDKLKAVVRHIAGAGGPRPQLQQMLNFESSRGSPRLLYIFERYLQPFTLKLTPVISALVRDGVLRPVPWHVLFFLLSAPGNAIGTPALAELLGKPKHDSEGADLFADLIVNALKA